MLADRRRFLPELAHPPPRLLRSFERVAHRMGLWSFGKDSEIGLMTRVVSAVAADGVRLRGKLTLHFRGPRPRGAADAAADTCAVIAAQIIAQTHDHRKLIGDEAVIVDRIHKVLPEEFPPCRSIELVALHVVDDGPQPGRARVDGAPRAVPSAAVEAARAPAAARAVPAAASPAARPAPEPAPERTRAAPVARFSLPMPTAKPGTGRRRSAPRISLPEQPAARAPGRRRSEPAAVAARRSETPAGRAEPKAVARGEARARGDGARGRIEPARGKSAMPASRKPASRRLSRRTAALVSALAALPEGASVDAIRGPIGWFLRDASARLAIALVLAVDEPSFDVMTAIDTGAPAAERADVQRLLQEATACVAALFYVELLEADLPQNVAIDTLQHVGDALPGGALPVAEISRYLGTEDVGVELATAAGSVLQSEDSLDLAGSLASPLFDLRERLREVAAQVKRAVGL